MMTPKENEAFDEGYKAGYIEKVNNILWPKPLDPPTTSAEAEARQRRFEDNIRYIQG